MSIIIGLDIGGSTTKIIGLRQDGLIDQDLVRASDPVASAFGALGKFLSHNHLIPDEIEKIMVTGVGSSYLRGDLLGVRTIRTEEFKAIGLGGLYVSDLEEAIVVSLGTGTAFVKASPVCVEHLIGSGVGGGTLQGLADRMIHIRDIDLFTALAEQGDLSRIDLKIRDITQDEIPGLPPDTTASNFGKRDESATPEDIALGIVNLVFQSVGTIAVMAARAHEINTIVFTGNLSQLDQGKRVLQVFSDLYDVNVIVPELAKFATAIGAALSGC